jgi:hypothetical protein
MTHWIIRKTAEGDGNDPNNVDPEQFRQHQRAKLLLHSPRERVQYLAELDASIGASDGTSLRSKAELMQLRSEIQKTHQQLLALKR